MKGSEAQAEVADSKPSMSATCTTVPANVRRKQVNKVGRHSHT